MPAREGSGGGDWGEAVRTGTGQINEATLATAHLPVRELSRLAHILGVTATQGFGRYVERLRLKAQLPGSPATQAAGDARCFRAALEELGPTFIKFGQALSVRQDLFAEEVIAELQQLQDRVPPFPAAQARAIVEEELGAPVSELFAAFERYAPGLLLRGLVPGIEAGRDLARAYRALSALRHAAGELPAALSEGLRAVSRGEARLRLQHEPLDSFERHIDRASNRLSFSLIIAAVVVGSSLVMAFHTGPHYEGIPLLGLIGYVIAALLGVAWAVAILRSGKF